MPNYVSGPLKLKAPSTQVIRKKGGKKKKSLSKSTSSPISIETIPIESLPDNDETSVSEHHKEATASEGLIENGDEFRNLTDAEIMRMLALRKRQKERIEKQLSLTHREKIEKFNAHLSTLSEHFDIPKVGPG